MRSDSLQLDEGRISGRIDFCDEILKEASSSQKSRCRKIPRESGHGLELLGDNHDFHLMEVDRPSGIIKDATEFFFYPIFHSLNPEGMAKARVKQADVRSGINPAFDGLAWWRVLVDKPHIDDRRPMKFFVRECRMRLRHRPHLAGKPQQENTRAAQSLGIRVMTGLDSPAFSAAATTSS